MNRRSRRTLITAALGLAAVVSLGLAASRWPRPPAPAEHELNALVARCVEAMTREACVAQRDRAGANSPAASQVFVAGVGAIDAAAYNEIRASGEAMCSLVKSRCVNDWNDSACEAARSLWPGQRPT